MPVDPVQLVEIINAIGARGHQAFDGSLWPNNLGIGEWLTIKVIQAPTGDYRDWPAIRAWAGEINTALSARSAASVPATPSAGLSGPP
jgi:menaquinone-dependent protoporphyrinogen oxidase